MIYLQKPMKKNKFLFSLILIILIIYFIFYKINDISKYPDVIELDNITYEYFIYAGIDIKNIVIQKEYININSNNFKKSLKDRFLLLKYNNRIRVKPININCGKPFLYFKTYKIQKHYSDFLITWLIIDDKIINMYIQNNNKITKFDVKTLKSFIENWKKYVLPLYDE